MPSWLSGLSDPQLNVIVSGVLFFGGLGMLAFGIIRSRLDKWLARGREVAAAVTSAERRTPVTVTVTPPGEPNVAVRVSAAEQNAAPDVPINQAPLPAPRPA